ncbi:MAG: cyclophilin-like fold protein [Eubacteriales bacterium]|nr:cyclophilin-like fold protein [Eubacteriales bacterium]
MKKRTTAILTALMAVGVSAALTGCGGSASGEQNISEEQSVSEQQEAEESAPASGTDQNAEETGGEEETVTELTVRFGDDGEAFTLHIYDNDTAAAIARYVGTSDWRLPIYHYDDYDDWEVMQYYDIPDRYEIPSAPETVTEERAGEVYYSEPNRIVLFYQDAEISGEYTPVGYFDATEEFVTAVEENPVLEGWGNKIVRISL